MGETYLGFVGNMGNFPVWNSMLWAWGPSGLFPSGRVRTYCVRVQEVDGLYVCLVHKYEYVFAYMWFVYMLIIVFMSYVYMYR